MGSGSARAFVGFDSFVSTLSAPRFFCVDWKCGVGVQPRQVKYHNPDLGQLLLSKLLSFEQLRVEKNQSKLLRLPQAK
jgi:hypothetical protein